MYAAYHPVSNSADPPSPRHAPVMHGAPCAVAGAARDPRRRTSAASRGSAEDGPAEEPPEEEEDAAEAGAEEEAEVHMELQEAPWLKAANWHRGSRMQMSRQTSRRCASVASQPR